MEKGREQKGIGAKNEEKKDEEALESRETFCINIQFYQRLDHIMSRGKTEMRWRESPGGEEGQVFYY